MTVRLWDAATGAGAATLTGHTKVVRGVAFSPDGRTLASASNDRTVRVWDAMTGRCLMVLRGHAAAVHAVAFSPNGRRIASAGSDATVRLWDAATGQEVIDLRGHAEPVEAVAFRPDGRALASASGDRTLRIWDATPMTPELRSQRKARDVVESLFDRYALTPEVLDRVQSAATLDPETRQRTLDLADRYGASRLEHEAERRVELLCDRAMLRAEVLASLRADASLSEPARHRALALAELVPENPERLNAASKEVIRRPGAVAVAYGAALRQAEAACRLVPDNADFLTTAGAAQFRIGLYREAVATLSRAERLDAEYRETPGAAYLAFLAMSLHELGRQHEARAYAGRLRETLKTEGYDWNQLGREFLHEAETLLGNADFPADPFAR